MNVYVVGAVEATGHPEFQEITIPKGSRAKLINSMDQITLQNAYNQMERKFWGWSVEVIVNNQIVEYKGDTVFAKKNNTSQPLKYTRNHQKRLKIVE